MPKMPQFTDWLVWQLADSAFPAGAFAHSFGLEAAWQQGEVDGATLGAFVRDAVAQAAHGSLPFVSAAHREPDGVAAIDAHCEAFVRTSVANRASRVQGRAWLTTVERSFPRSEIAAVADRLRASSSPRHFAPVYGATLRALGVPLETTERLFVFGTCRALLSAAVRLGITGTTAAQRLLAEMADELESLARSCSDLAMSDAAQSAPLIDLWQGAHDRLYSRLFQS